MEMACKGLPEAMAQAAARWWAGKIDGTCRHDNGDKSLTGFMSGYLADKLNEPPIPGALEKFEEILTNMLVHWDKPWRLDRLSCDYGPDMTMLKAAQEAGISPHNFPWKTHMYFDHEKMEIVVSDGYRAPWKMIWKDGVYEEDSN